MNFQTFTAFTLTLTKDEVDTLLNELSKVNNSYWCDSFDDFFAELITQAEFCNQYDKKSAYELKDSIRAIPYDERGAMMNNLDYAISRALQ